MVPPPPRAPQKPRWDCAVWTCDAWEWMGVLGWRWGHEIQNPATWTPRTLRTWTPEPWGHGHPEPWGHGLQNPGVMNYQIPGHLGTRSLGTWTPRSLGTWASEPWGLGHQMPGSPVTITVPPPCPGHPRGDSCPPGFSPFVATGLCLLPGHPALKE